MKDNKLFVFDMKNLKKLDMRNKEAVMSLIKDNPDYKDFLDEVMQLIDKKYCIGKFEAIELLDFIWKYIEKR